jgi:signal transduction histidine kinase
MPLTKAKVVLLMLIGGLTAASPNILRILTAVLLLIYIIRYREDESAARMAAFVAVGYSVALYPSPWHALASGAMLYLIYRRWEDAGFLGLLSGLSMVSAYTFYMFAEQKLGWVWGIRLFYTDAVTAFLIHGILFNTGVAVTAISVFLIFMKIAEETAEAEAVERQMLRKMAPKLHEEKKETAEKKEATAEEDKKEEKAVVEEKPAEEKKVKVRLPRSVEI